MADVILPRRSVLYMPGANERALEKAKGLAADALILDLEDAVAPDAKADARDRVCAAASSGEYGAKEVAIRVNGLATEWHAADIAAAAEGLPPWWRPKVDSVDDVHAIERGSSRLAARRPHQDLGHGRDAGGHAPRRGHRCRAGAPHRAGDGTNDLAKELHAEHARSPAPCSPASACACSPSAPLGR
ncbi:MAG: aldolase/citrate lyase family protein [Acidimicrobiales bacterium]